MKHFNHKATSWALFLLCCIGLCACKEDLDQEGEGRLAINAQIAAPENISMNEELLSDSLRIRVYSNKGLVRFYKGLDNVPSDLWLNAGDYRITAVTGDSVPATFKTGYYKGETNFTIKAGETTDVAVPCKIINTLVSISYTDELKAILSDYQVTVSSKNGSLTFTSQHLDSIGYFILPQNESSLNWTITGNKTNGDVYSESGTLQNVKAATRYDLQFGFTETEYTNGGAYFRLVVDESAVEKVENIIIYKRPDIEGNGFDIKQQLIFESNSQEEISVWVRASSALSQLIVSGENMQAMGFPDNDIDLMSASEIDLASWSNVGLSHYYNYDSSNDISNAKITLSASLIGSLTEGMYNINIKATDMHAKEWNETVQILISNATVLTEPAIRHEIWAHRATLRGTLLQETTEALTFEYRVKGTNTWHTIDATRGENNSLTAVVGNLQDGTTYEYRAVAGSMASAKIVEFTTESKFVIPNAGFENWHQEGNVLLIYGSGESMWWDSGNHGSAIMGINITTQDTSIKHSGNSSIKMGSRFVGLGSIGKFAAGNVFSGVYAGTDGMDGILDFGRTMNSRPSKFTGYYKYVTGEVTHSNTDELPKGSPNDKGNIYIAIGDWDKPIHITTKDKSFFDKNDEHIIGFGEIIPTESTPGDDLIPFSIDIEYRATDRIPTYIVIVASASYYGDFFTGSTSSIMWLDDLELIYE